MPRNTVGVRFDPGAPLLDPLAITKIEGREEVMLAAIGAGGGYQ